MSANVILVNSYKSTRSRAKVGDLVKAKCILAFNQLISDPSLEFCCNPLSSKLLDKLLHQSSTVSNENHRIPIGMYFFAS